jgi:hypothetical protein
MIDFWSRFWLGAWFAGLDNLHAFTMNMLARYLRGPD